MRGTARERGAAVVAVVVAVVMGPEKQVAVGAAEGGTLGPCTPRQA
jgi:hypothetical protein